MQSCSSTDKDELSPSTPQNNSSSFLTGKNGNVQSADCPPPSRTRACNLKHTVEGPLGNAKLIGEEVESFLWFFKEDMPRMIIEHTNKYGKNYKEKDNWSPVDLDEIKGIIGLFFVMGVYKLQYESLRSMWSSGPSCRAIFPAAFGRNHFEEIVACLRFDNRDTHLQREQTDKFAPFRCFWNRFIKNCRKHYPVSAYVTIDKQLIPFRGRCGFR